MPRALLPRLYRMRSPASYRSGPLSIGARDLLARHKHGDTTLLLIDVALALHRSGITSLRSCRDWLSGETTSVACGSLTYSLAMAVRRSWRGPTSCTRPC